MSEEEDNEYQIMQETRKLTVKQIKERLVKDHGVEAEQM